MKLVSTIAGAVWLMAIIPAHAQTADTSVSLSGAAVGNIAALAALASPAGVSASAKPTSGDTRFQRLPGRTNAVALLAGQYPPKARAEVTASFQTLLDAIPKIEAHYGLAENDMATAVALFISGAHSAYSGHTGPESRFATLVRQMRTILAAKPALAAASDRDKQAAFEQLAILGLFTEATVDALEKNPRAPNAAGIRVNLREAGKRYLETFLGTDAANVKLGTVGLTFAPETPAARSVVSPVAGARDAVAAISANVGRIADVVLARGSGTGYNSMVTLVFRPRILFRDGTYSEDPDAVFEPKPVIDGRWRRDGKGWVLTGKDGQTSRFGPDSRARPAAPGSTLSGEYANMSGVGAANTGVAVVSTWNNFEFYHDGTVVSDRGAGASTSSLVTGGRRTGSARYRLEGYSIVFQRPDGQAERKLFYYFPDSDKAIGFGDSTLTLRD